MRHSIIRVLAVIYPTAPALRLETGMVKKSGSKRIFWLPRHSDEVRVRLALGQSASTIAAAFGCNLATIRGHIRREGLCPAEQTELIGLILAIERAKAIEGLLEAEPGSIGQARLRTAVKDNVGGQATDEKQGNEMSESNQIGEMSEDELQAYVASMVPGLEAKSFVGAEPRGVGNPGEVSVSVDSETGSKTAEPES